MASTEPSDVSTRTAVLEHRADTTDRALESLRHDVNQGFSDLRHEVTRRFDQMNERMDQHLRWVITTVITTAFAIIGANVGVLALLLRAH